MSVAPDGRVRLSFQDQRLLFHCSGDLGSASAGIEVIALTGTPEGEYWYSARQLTSCLKALKGTTRPLGNLANETLRLKRKETHQVFDSFWKERGMTRTQAYHWMAKKLRLSEQLAHIGGFEMDRCQRLIDLCEKERNKETA